MIGLLGKKVGMSQLFEKDGKHVPVTVLEVGPCYVTDLRTQERDGYTAVQLGFDQTREKTLAKPNLGHLKRSKSPALKFVREIRTEDVEGLQLGQQLKADNFEEGDFVDIVGRTIGKGFQGVVKRHGFKGSQSMSHGTKFGREPGSTGQSATPSRVLKNVKLPGRMGNEMMTVQNLKVLKVNADENWIAVKGAVPGVEGGYLVIQTALKRKSDRKWKVPQQAEDKPSQEAAKEETKPASDKPQEKAPEAKGDQGSEAPATDKSEKAEKDEKKE